MRASGRKGNKRRRVAPMSLERCCQIIEELREVRRALGRGRRGRGGRR